MLIVVNGTIDAALQNRKGKNPGIIILWLKHSRNHPTNKENGVITS